MNRAAQGSSATGFDASAVPVFPVVRLESGQGRVRVDGVPVEPVSGQSAMQTAVGLVAQRAARSNSRGVRVVVVDEQGREFQHVVDASGGIHDAQAAPSGGGAARARHNKRLGWALLAGVLAFVLLAGTVVWVAARSRQHVAAAKPSHTVTVSHPVAAKPTQLPVVGPQGWSQVAAWGSSTVANASDASEAGAAAAMVTADGSIYAVLQSGDSNTLTLVSLSARNGTPVWSVKLAGTQAATAPVVARVAGRAVVLAASDEQVVAVGLDGSKPSRWSIPDDAADPAVRLTAGGPIISTSTTQVQVVNAAGSLVSRSVPAAAQPWWPLPDGRLVSADASGHAWVSASPTVAGDEVSLPGPAKTKPSAVVAATGRSGLVVSWSPDGTEGSQSVLVAYTLPGLKRTWTSKPLPQVDASSVVVATDGRHAATGETLVDLATGKYVALVQDLTPVAFDGDRLWATDETGLVSVDFAGHVARSGSTSDSGTDVPTATPVGSVGSSLLVAGQDAAGATRLFLLPRLSSSSAAGSSSSSAAPSSTAAPKSSTSAAKKGKNAKDRKATGSTKDSKKANEPEKSKHSASSSKKDKH